MTRPSLATIGVYGWTVGSFVDALHRAGVRQLLDIRQRRGVRGSEYVWANAARLQKLLEDAGIEYRHVKELAPTTELRQRQYREDARRGVGIRARTELAPAYRDGYVREVLDRTDLAPVAAALPTDGAAALFCVEREPAACHRSLAAERLAAEAGRAVEHLVP